MKSPLITFLCFLIISHFALAQTSTTTTGTWNDPTIWTAGVPTGAITANVNHTVEINTNITVASGATYNIFQSATDFPGGSTYSLTVNGTLDVQGGTTYFEAAVATMTSNGSSIRVRSGATLRVKGPTAFANGTTVLIDAGGTLIIDGNFDNNIAGAGSFTVQGLVQINGNYTSNGNVDILGSGDFITTGTITTTGASGEVFGSPNDCSTGPCSGQNLCLGGGVNIIASNQYICSGSSAAGLTGDAVAAATGYQWQSSTTSSSSGFANITGATSQNYNPGTPTQTTWYKRRVTTASCTGTSSAIVITIIPGSSWRGTTSSDWNVTANWCNNTLPDNTTDVVIPAGVPNLPVVSSATVALCRDLTINSGATVTINSTRQINVSGNLINNGTFSNNGTVQFNGGSAQSISGSGFSSYANVIINNSSGVTIPSTGMNVSSQLTLTAGLVNLSSANLTIGVSGSVGTLSYTAGWLYNGNLTRWIPASTLTTGGAPGHFPIGSTSNYRPIFIGNSGGVTTSGTIRVNHTQVSGSSVVAFSDAGTPIQVRSNSFWTLATGNSLATANTFSVRSEGTGFGTVGAVSDLRLTLVGGVVGTTAASGGTTTNPQVNRIGVSTANLSNNFYWGSINSTATTLPVTITAFNGVVEGNKIVLDWTTSSEINFNYFVIEKSIDGESFSEIGRVAGHGTTNAVSNYQFTDSSPIIGKNYYRLKSVDFDDYTEYFDIVSVEYSRDKQFTVYPNPTDGKSINIKINFSVDNDYGVVVLNNMGVEIARIADFGSEATLVFSKELTSGLYFARFFTAGFSKTVRFVVQN